MTNDERLYRLLSTDPRIDAVVRGRINNEYPTKDSKRPLILFVSIGDDPLHTLNNGPGTVPEDFQVECWAPDAESRSALRDLIRSRLGGENGSGYSDRDAGILGIIRQSGGAPIEADQELSLFGWQDTYRVIARDSD